MCLYPKIIKNKKYTVTKKNNGIIPECIDERTKYVPIKCNKCEECVKQKAREWQLRLTEDIRHNKNGKFITLTFSNDHLAKLIKGEDLNGKQIYKPITGEGYELDNQIATIATRRFLERWRKKHKKSLRHWLITELGHEGTENIHIHGIVWTKEQFKEIKNIWAYGFIYPRTEDEEKLNYITERTINYMTKYVTKQDAKHKKYSPKLLVSAGIGAGYTNRSDSKTNKYKTTGKTDETYTTRTGHKIGIPIYWRNKIYTEEEREKLWIQKLDKNERWVRGEKIDISKGEEEYYKALNWGRKQAKQLGYNDDSKNWDRIKYENDRRKLNLKSRISSVENTAEALNTIKEKPTKPRKAKRQKIDLEEINKYIIKSKSTADWEEI